MFLVPSTLQIVLGLALVLLGVCGNLILPFVSNRTILRCPHITVLAALDFAAAMLGPGLMLVTIVIGPTWLEHNKSLCHSLSFLSSWMFITTFLVLFFLAVFCQNVQHNIHLDGRRRARRREFVFLAVCLLTGLLLGCFPLLGWSSYNGLAFLHACTIQGHVQTSSYSIFYLASSLFVLSITIFFAAKAIKWSRFYPLQLLWERHVLETRINDPEMTTTASSAAYSSSGGSRASSFSHKLSGVTSARSTPLVIRKSSQKTVPREETVNVLLMLEIIARETSRNAQQTEPEASHLSVPSDTSCVPQNGTARDPFVISSQVPHRYPMRKKVFESPRRLPRLQALIQQRSLSRLLSLRCCVTLICWLPLYVIVVLQLSSVHSPQELHVFIQWLIFFQSSISPLLPLGDASYRQVWRRAACLCFKACAQKNGTRADLSKSRGMESRIEGSQQVRLTEVIRLDASSL